MPDEGDVIPKRLQRDCAPAFADIGKHVGPSTTLHWRA